MMAWRRKLEFGVNKSLTCAATATESCACVSRRSCSAPSRPNVDSHKATRCDIFIKITFYTQGEERGRMEGKRCKGMLLLLMFFWSFQQPVCNLMPKTRGECLMSEARVCKSYVSREGFSRKFSSLVYVTRALVVVRPSMHKMATSDGRAEL